MVQRTGKLTKRCKNSKNDLYFFLLRCIETSWFQSFRYQISHLASVKVVPLSSTFTVSSEGSVECSSEWISEQGAQVNCEQDEYFKLNSFLLTGFLLGVADEAKKEKSYDLVRESHGCFLKRVYLCWDTMLQWNFTCRSLKIKYISHSSSFVPKLFVFYFIFEMLFFTYIWNIKRKNYYLFIY